VLVLVDYDNLPRADRQVGVDHIVRKLIALIPTAALAGPRPRVRLYGGWYEAGKLTKAGQAISAEIRSCSPIRFMDTDGAVTLVDVELVYSSLAHPKVVVGNTYREQRIRGGIKCEERPWIQCSENLNCPLVVVESFFNQGACINSLCTIRPEDVLFRKEQKVVDTMMVADLAHADSQGYDRLCVVSRDDDIWPGLGIATLKAKCLIHITTAASIRMPSYFSALPSPPYSLAHWI
jgi:hypothetical protein